MKTEKYHVKTEKYPREDYPLRDNPHVDLGPGSLLYILDDILMNNAVF